MDATVKVIIPAYNEARSIAKVIKALSSMVSEIVVINNNSSDETAKIAQDAGATVLTENKRGYGRACKKGINYIKAQKTETNIIVFLDGDYSDYPEELTKIIAPIIDGRYRFCSGQPH